MKHSQTPTGEKSTTRWDTVLLLMVKDQEVVEALSSSHLTSILMTSSKTLGFLVKTKTLSPRSILKITSRHTRMVPADKGIISRSFLLEVDCSMTCLKTWRKCFLLVASTPPVGARCRLKTGSMDPASTAGLSLSAGATWSRRTLTAPASSAASSCPHQTRLGDCPPVSMMRTSFL